MRFARNIACDRFAARNRIVPDFLLTSFRTGGRFLAQEHAVVAVRLKFRVLVDDLDLSERSAEELIHADVALPKLIFDGGPGYESGLGRINSMQAPSKPGVD